MGKHSTNRKAAGVPAADRAAPRSSAAKGNGRKKPLVFYILLGVLAAAFLFSAYKVADILLTYNTGRREYNRLRQDYSPRNVSGLYEALQTAEGPSYLPSEESYQPPEGDEAPETVMPEITDEDFDDEVLVLSKEMAVDFDALFRTNSDTLGWLIIPGTTVSYPVVHSHDNKEYVTRTFSGKGNPVGTVFMDYMDSHDLSSRQNLFYGHNMKDGSIFAPLVNYKTEDFFRDHRNILFITPDYVIRLRVFSAYYAAAADAQRTIEFADDTAFADYVQGMLGRCKFSDERVENIQQVFTFVTCSYELQDARTFVHANVIGAYRYRVED